MVIFKLLLILSFLYWNSNFTFQYGDIQIYFLYWDSCKTHILYIPIWWYSNTSPTLYVAPSKSTLHSNMVIFKLHLARILESKFYRFTFQYGDIQIDSNDYTDIQLFCFTFQYGDIQITFSRKSFNNYYWLYIPIWWYSNFQGFQWQVDNVFALHSNMVIFKLM